MGDRIIPAYAGSTFSSKNTDFPTRDHPRIRGEHKIIHYQMALGVGSSPHTRGALFASVKSGRPSGIIPAYAGSTINVHGNGEVRRDHPRIRGEHQQEHQKIRRQVGSSPHTRGARSSCLRLSCCRRIIPAYAGSTSYPTRGRWSRWDHPRIRGEHFLTRSTTLSMMGSSPHTRGAPRPHYSPCRLTGIIPAYAGSTFNPISKPDSTRDHPRIRGEHDSTTS